jgi:RHS repeat-associated protein
MGHPPRWHQTALNGGPSFTQSFSATTNQITGYNYDAAGNMWGDGVYTYTYDAEGNVLTVSGNDTSASYVYDAQNHRARVQTGSTANEFLVDFAGRQISTWNAATNMGNEGRIYWDGKQIANRAADGTTYFEHQDYLGTERVRTNAAGSEVGIFQSLPWGDGYTAVNVSDDGGEDTLHFAGLDLDVDGTSHAQFRNYSSAQGRWLAPDPYDGSYDITNPQSFNRYSYVQNNPLIFTDPSGQSVNLPLGDPSLCNIICDIFTAGVGAAIGAIAYGLESIFDAPKFHGTLAPRPSAGTPDWGDDPGSFGESLGIGSNLKTGSWGIAPALGLPDAGCEFGACGVGPMNATPLTTLNPDVRDPNDDQIGDIVNIGFAAEVVGRALYKTWYYTSPGSCFYVKAVADNPVGVGVPISAGVLALGITKKIHPAIATLIGVYTDIYAPVVNKYICSPGTK